MDDTEPRLPVTLWGTDPTWTPREPNLLVPVRRGDPLFRPPTRATKGRGRPSTRSEHE